MGRTSTTRFLMLLTTATTTPSPLLHLSCPSFLRLSLRTIPRPLSSYFPRRRLLSSPSRLGLTSSHHFHSQATPIIPTSFISSPLEHHPWPEWPNFVHYLSSAGYFNGEGFDVPPAVPGLPEDFLRAASACFSFARDRVDILGMLPRRDIEVVVENGAPFLFENADESVRRMRLFLTGNVLPSDRREVAVDLMKYLLSYLSNVVSSERNNLHNSELVEPSVRNLLLMMYQLSYSNNTAQTDYRNNNNAQESYQSGLVENQVPYEYQPTARPLGQSIEMKRGDWICPRCSFMNFARNVKCLDCEEARPKKQLTGSEWECPQCEFFNYGRNTACLRCDCRRPGGVSIGTTNFGSGLEYGNGNNAFEADVGRRLAANEENSQRWFSKVSQLDSSSDTSGAIADEDFPEIMPLRKGVNRFVVSTRKTPLERRLSNAQYQRNWDNSGNLESNGGTRGSSSNSVPFVPLPPDMFAKKPDKSGVDEKEVEANEKEALAPGAGRQTGGRLEQSLQANEKSTGPIESNDIEKEQVEKSDRWFKRVTELHGVTDTSSEISDGDFPDVMPMLKGENRFVVSKKKDRSLTSPKYKRHLALGQANTTNHVPFVPFPPNYFARKDDQQLDDKSKSLNVPEKFDETSPSISHVANVPGLENQQSGAGNLRPYGQNLGGTMSNSSYEARTSGSSAQNAVDSPPGGSESWSNQRSTYNNTRGTQNLLTEPLQNFSSPQKSSTGTGSSDYPTSENSSSTSNLKETSQPSEDENLKSSWRRKSLEGSLVKETDSLDMSEEAKAERWFRRVAQIKDISELSQIPDEDFPSIMPMRKGVNRFVVSKRKTPLERRLTSTRYRRNLPIVSSDPAKENDTN